MEPRDEIVVEMKSITGTSFWRVIVILPCYYHLCAIFLTPKHRYILQVTSDEKLIRDDELFGSLIMPVADLKNVTVVCIMDCCHSGTILDLPYQYIPESKSWRVSTHRPGRKAIEATIIALSGCADKEVSWGATVGGKRQGVMTYSVQQALQAGNTTLHDIFVSVRKTLKDESPAFDPGARINSQVSQLSCSKRPSAWLLPLFP